MSVGRSTSLPLAAGCCAIKPKENRGQTTILRIVPAGCNEAGLAVMKR